MSRSGDGRDSKESVPNSRYLTKPLVVKCIVFFVINYEGPLRQPPSFTYWSVSVFGLTLLDSLLYDLPRCRTSK